MSAGIFDLFVSFRVLILFLHVMAVLTWVGGLVYQVLVVVPLAGKGAANGVCPAHRLGLRGSFQGRHVAGGRHGVVHRSGERDERVEQSASGWRQPADCFRDAAGHQIAFGSGHDSVAGRPAVGGVSPTSGSGCSDGVRARCVAGRTGDLAAPCVVASRCHGRLGRSGHSVRPSSARLRLRTSADGLRTARGLLKMVLFFQQLTMLAKRALRGVARGIGMTCQRVQGGKEK